MGDSFTEILSRKFLSLDLFPKQVVLKLPQREQNVKTCCGTFMSILLVIMSIIFCINKIAFSNSIESASLFETKYKDYYLGDSNRTNDALNI